MKEVVTFFVAKNTEQMFPRYRELKITWNAQRFQGFPMAFWALFQSVMSGFLC